jgi:hypothetical protein
MAATHDAQHLPSRAMSQTTWTFTTHSSRNAAWRTNTDDGRIAGQTKTTTDSVRAACGGS